MDTQKTDKPLDSSKPDLWYVSPEQLQTLWGDISALLHRTPDDGALANWDEQELYDVLTSYNNSYGIWVGYHNKKLEAVIITTFIQPYSNEDRVLVIESGNGKLFKYRPYLNKIEKWAYDLGAIYSQIKGRFGLIRAMEPCGYEMDQVVLMKSLRKQWSH